MGRIAAESLVERLAECGVDTIFGLSGDVCLATSGPGAIHLLHGLYDAKLDHTPVLAITGTQETSVLGTGYQQEVHLEHLCADLAEYNLIVNSPAQPPGVVDIALRTALARRGVAHLSLPNDIRVADADGPWQHVAPARPATAAPSPRGRRATGPSAATASASYGLSTFISLVAGRVIPRGAAPRA